MKKFSKEDFKNIEDMLKEGFNVDVISETLNLDKELVKQYSKQLIKQTPKKLMILRKNMKNVQEVLLKHGMLSENELISKLKVAQEEFHSARNELEKQGIILEKSRTGWFISPTPSGAVFEYKAQKGEIIGVITDSHFCSKHQQLTYLNMAYDHFGKMKVRTVFHLGDLTDGQDVYKGQFVEQFDSTFDGQMQYTSKNYPKRDGIKTKVISGNHDDSFMKKTGADIVSAIVKERSDMEYLGRTDAYVVINGLKYYLVHPKGGLSYAKSYRPQKFAENFAPENKPNIALFGHWHSFNYTTARNIELILCPCFQSQTNFEKQLGLDPAIGYLWIDVDSVDIKGEIKEFGIRKRSFYIPKVRDY